MSKFNLDRLKFYSLVLVALTIPLPMLINNIAIILMIAVFFAEWIKSKVTPKTNKIGVFIILLFVSSGISIIYSCDFESGLKVIEKYLTFVIFPITVSCYNFKRKEYFYIQYAFVTSVLLVFIYALLIASFDYLKSGSMNVFNPENLVLENRFTYHRLMGLVNMSATVFALYLVFSLAIVFNSGFIGKIMVKYKKYHLILLVFFFLSISLMNSFTAYIALALIFAFVPIFLKIKSKQYILLLIPFALALTFFISKATGVSNEVLKYDLTENAHSGKWNSLNIRLAKWECSMSVIKENFPLGTGVGCAQQTLDKKYADLNFHVGVQNSFSSHNQFLHYLLESGVLTLIIFMIFLIYGLTKSIRRKNFLLYAILVLLLTSSITDNFLIVNKGIVFFIFFICLASLKSTSLENE